MANLKCNGQTVRFDDAGEGPPVVFVHGSFSTAAAWKGVGERLLDRFRIVAPDLWGYGGSDDHATDSKPSIDHQIRLVECVVDRVEEPVHLVGHSYGGTVAAATALAGASKLARLTLIEPLPVEVLRQAGENEAYAQVRNMYSDYIGAYERGDRFACQHVIDFWGGAGSFESFPERLKEYCAETTTLNLKDWSAAWGFDSPLDKYRALHVPTLIICGMLTNWVATKIGEVLTSVIPDSRLVNVDGASHFVIATHPNEIAELITDHVSRASDRQNS